MHLVIDKMVKFEHVLVTNRYRTLKRLTRATVIQCCLACYRQIGQFKHTVDFGLFSAIEYRRRHRHAIAQVSGEFHQLVFIERFQIHLLVGMVVDLVKELANLGNLGLLVKHLADFVTQALGCPAQVSLKNLAHVHT